MHAMIWKGLCQVVFIRRTVNARIRMSDVQIKLDARTHAATDKYRCCNYCFFTLRSGCCMKHDINVAEEIFHPQFWYRSHCMHIFLMLQELISNILQQLFINFTINRTMKKIIIGRVQASHVEFDLVIWSIFWLRNISLFFLFSKNVLYRNICLVSQFTVLYPCRLLPGGMDLYVIKI